MIELALLNAVIAHRDLSALVRHGLLDESHFPEQRDAFNYIRQHVEKYGEVPSVESVVSACPHFEAVEVYESTDTLCAKLHERNLKLAERRLLETAAAKYGEMDGYAVLDYLSDGVERLRQRVQQNNAQSVTNWATDAEKRLQEYERRKQKEFHTAVPLLFDAITEATGRAFRGEYINILAFTGVGKSWLACVQALATNHAGYKVLFESGEMAKPEIEFRLDTLETGLSNQGLWTGTLDPGAEERYVEWLRSQAQAQRPDLIIRGPDDWPMGLTLEQIRYDIKQYQPDLIIIDQFNLCRFRGSDHASKAEFSRQLKLLFAAEGIVGVVCNQADGEYGARRDRQAGGDDDDHGGDGVRELCPPKPSDYSETIATIQDANKVLSFDAVKWRDPATGKDRGKALLSVEKSRSGGEGTQLELHWLPNDGVIRPREPMDIF